MPSRRPRPWSPGRRWAGRPQGGRAGLSPASAPQGLPGRGGAPGPRGSPGPRVSRGGPGTFTRAQGWAPRGPGPRRASGAAVGRLTPPSPVSPGRARAARTDGTRGPWRSAGVTRDPGPNRPGTHGTSCPPHRPLPLAPLCPPCCPVYTSTPGSAGGQRREGGPWTPRPAGSGVRPCAGVGRGLGTGPPAPGQARPRLASASVLFQGSPGKVGLQGPKVKGKPAGRVLGAGGGGLPPSVPTPLQPPLPPCGLVAGGRVSAHTWRARP